MSRSLPYVALLWPGVKETAAAKPLLNALEQAKLESPLREMRGGGGSQVLSVLARVDFFGTDVAGRAIQVTGTMNITFADFANE